MPLQLGPVAGLVSLQQLDVSCNQLSSLFALSGLSALTQLTCEGNGITSLVGIGSLSSLVELYAAHNNIGDIKVDIQESLAPAGTCKLKISTSPLTLTHTLGEMHYSVCSDP